MPFKLELSPGEINDLQSGKEEPYNKIFEETYPPLCDYIYSISDGANDGEDIAQEALIKFYSKRTNFATVEKIMSFLFTTCKNAYINWLKHEGVKQKHIGTLKNEFDMTEPAYVETEYLHIIYAEIEKLPAECKKVFTLLYIHGYTNQEVMAKLNMSASLVSHHKRYAIDKLKIGLGNKGLIIIALIVTIFLLKFFLGSFSIYGGMVVHYYITACNHCH